MQFDFDISKVSSNIEDGEAIYKISLKGEFTFKGHNDFSSAISDLMQKGIKKIIIDLNDLNTIDSVGIGLLINYNKKLQNETGELVMTRCNDQILNIFLPINIERIIRIFGNLEDGINYLSSPKSQ